LTLFFSISYLTLKEKNKKNQYQLKFSSEKEEMIKYLTSVDMAIKPKPAGTV
jgi:hypothetical protein